MPLQTLLRAALPFMVGGALAIFVSELSRDAARPSDSFPDSWFRDAAREPENLWTGEPSFDWGDRASADTLKAGTTKRCERWRRSSTGTNSRVERLLSP